MLIPAPGVSLSQVVHKHIPKGVKFSVTNTESLPDRTFRDAWEKVGKEVKINLPKAKELVHTLRRAKREQEFKPHDDIVMKQIPGFDLTDVEKERENIRQKYWGIQEDIDACKSSDELKEIIIKEALDGVHI